MMDNHLSLDSIGIAGLGHDFGSLDGKHTPLSRVFDSFASTPQTTTDSVLMLLDVVLPLVRAFPNQHTRFLETMGKECEKLADALIQRIRNVELNEEKSMMDDRSMIGILLKFFFRCLGKRAWN
jgi:hypothetical protein